MSAQELETLTNSISVLNSLLSIDAKIRDGTLLTSATNIIGAINELKTQIIALQESINNQSPTA